MLYSFIIATGSGIAGALLGLGGGIFLVPLLVFFLSVPLQIAAGASIVAVVATSNAAAANYVREELTNVRLGLFLETATTIGAVSGAFLISVVSEGILRIVFGLSLLYAAGSMYLKQRGTNNTWTHKPNDHLAERLHLEGTYFDEEKGEEVVYGVDRTPLTFGISYIAGIISGLLGIGGGGIKVPTMNAVSNVPIKAAIATSNFMIGMTAATSALVYIRHGYCDLFQTAPVVLGTLLGASLGARVTNRVSSRFLRQAFILVLLVMAARMIISGVRL